MEGEDNEEANDEDESVANDENTTGEQDEEDEEITLRDIFSCVFSFFFSCTFICVLSTVISPRRNYSTRIFIDSATCIFVSYGVIPSLFRV